jgi:hypothetical protein
MIITNSHPSHAPNHTLQPSRTRCSQSTHVHRDIHSLYEILMRVIQTTYCGCPWTGLCMSKLQLCSSHCTYENTSFKSQQLFAAQNNTHVLGYNFIPLQQTRLLILKSWGKVCAHSAPQKQTNQTHAFLPRSHISNNFVFNILHG